MLSTIATIKVISVYLIVLHASNGVFAQECAAGSASQYKGNWYCSQVKAITYSGFPGKGRYNKVTNMDAMTGQCEFERYDYSGSLSPMNEELSFHVRGPVHLSQFVVYTLGKSATKRSEERNHYHRARHEPHDHRHGHQYLHHRDGRLKRAAKVDETELQGRRVGALVTATINGQVAVWMNSYAGPSTATVVPKSSPQASPDVSASQITTSAEKYKASPASSSAATTHTSEDEPTSGSWTRQAYYDAGSGSKEGLTFLNHFGGSGSGTTAGGYA